MTKNRPSPRTRAKKQECFERLIIQALQTKGESSALGIASWIKANRRTLSPFHYSYTVGSIVSYLKILVLKGVLTKTRFVTPTKYRNLGGFWLYKLKVEQK